MTLVLRTIVGIKRKPLQLGIIVPLCLIVVGCVNTVPDPDPHTEASAQSQTGDFPVVSCPVKTEYTENGNCSVVNPRGKSTLIIGTVIGENAVYENGGVLIGEDGKIRDVGCDVDTPANDTTTLFCPSTIVSPGLINAHDHIRYTHQYPADWGEERFEHRHQWRLGLDGHTKIPYEPAEGNEQIAWGELRQVLSGTTSMAGEGGVPGLVRNLEIEALNRSVDQPSAFTTIFPLGDANGTMRDDGCDYPAVVSDDAYDDASSFQAHVAEGVDDNAANEFGCLTGQSTDGVDVTKKLTSFVHLVGTTTDDAIFMRQKEITAVWSPRSNISLYGQSANVSLYDALGVDIALSTDWIYSGSMNMLRELQCAKSFSDAYLSEQFSSFDLWQMATINAAKAFALDTEIGRLAIGSFGDIVIFSSHLSGTDPFEKMVSANASDVVLVLREGRPIVGNAWLVGKLRGENESCESLPTNLTCGTETAVCFTDTDNSSLDTILAANTRSYPLMFCSTEPEREPTCTPSWPGKYDGQRRVGIDDDGDGIRNALDNCKNVFNPIRPMDDDQPDFDGDGQGDACDQHPLTSERANLYD